MPEMPSRNLPSSAEIAERLSSIEMLLQGTQPIGYFDYYNPRSPVFGKEVSLGFIDKTDMMANDTMCWAILEFFNHALFNIAFDFMSWYQNDWKASMSIEGKLLDSLTSQEYRYTQSQTLHEYQHLPERKRIIRVPAPVSTGR